MAVPSFPRKPESGQPVVFRARASLGPRPEARQGDDDQDCVATNWAVFQLNLRGGNRTAFSLFHDNESISR